MVKIAEQTWLKSPLYYMRITTVGQLETQLFATTFMLSLSLFVLNLFLYLCLTTW